MSSHVTSNELLEKSIQAALSAIEIYNKPDFKYREEIFAILMCNSWELLLKAKALRDGGEDFKSIAATKTVISENGNPVVVAKTNRSGNLLTVDLLYLAASLIEKKASGLTIECQTNIKLLVEIRDNAVHLLNEDVALSRSVLEIGTASLRNYLKITSSWFEIDFSRYNFFLMPLSFFSELGTMHGLALRPATAESQRLEDYLSTERQSSNSDSTHDVALFIETKVVKGKGTDGVAVRWTDDPMAPAMRIKEEDLLERFPYDSGDLAGKLRGRYSDFKQDARYYKIKKPMDSDPKYCRVRYLDPKNTKSGSKNFYSTEAFKVFDLHYKKK